MWLANQARSRAVSLGFLLTAFLFAAWNIPADSPRSLSPSYPAALHAPVASPAASAQLLDTYAKLPLSFEVNRGQAGPEIQFLSRGRGMSLFLGSDKAAFLIDQKDSRALHQPPLSKAAQDISALFSPLSGTLTDKPAAIELHPDASVASHWLRMSLLGARPGLQGVGFDPLPGKANYFIGDDPKNWQVNVKTYATVKYEGIYPGIDLLYYGNQQRLEYDFIVAPGSSPRQIQVGFEGVDRARLDPSTGDLVLEFGDTELRFQKPSTYQTSENSSTAGSSSRHFVNCDYTLEAGNRVGFSVAAYDTSKPLVIDPVLSFFTYLGGMLADVGLHIAADATGIYVTGATTSPDFPTASALSSSLHSAFCNAPGLGKTFPCPDAFVTKLKPDGSGIIYSTYLGGSRSDIGIGIAVDSNQQAYVAGETESMDFPTTSGGFQSSATSRLARAFLAKLSSSGSLLYSTYLGGTPGSRGVGNDSVNDTSATSIAVDNTGHAYLSGYTRSNSLPTMPGVVQPNAGLNSGAGGVQCHSSNGGSIIPCSDGFVAKFDTNASGSGSLLYASYLGGSYYDAATGIAIDSAGNAYVAGATLSDDFPVVAAFQPSRKAGRCGPLASSGGGGHVCASAFIAKFNPTASALVYSSYLGGTGDTAALGVAVDSSGNAYLTGTTNAADFPATAGVTQRSLASASCSLAGKSVTCPDAFVAKVGSTGSLSYATFLGGAGVDLGFGIAVDSTGNAFVSGITNSTNFPTASPLQAALGSGTCILRISGIPYNLNCPDAFLTKLDPAGATLLYSTYLGGSNVDFATGVALDASNNVYVTGGTFSPGLSTPGAFQSMLGSKGDAFVFKVLAPPPPSFTLTAASPGGSTSAAVKAGQTATYNLQINPMGGFTGTVSFTCSGAPARATCNPPNPVLVSANSPVPFSVTVNTTAASAVPAGLWRIPSTRIPIWPIAFLLLVFLILARGNRLSLSNWRVPLLWATTLLFLSVSLVVGCGGNNSSGSSGNPGTPLGTSTLTLTGTSGSLSQNLSLTLTVQ